MKINNKQLNLIRVGMAFLCLLISSEVYSNTEKEKASKPNFIIIFTDDQGYGDLSCYGSTKIKTPHLDQMASEGRKLTSFMVASPVCSPSRAALLTGCYPKRVSMHRHVLFPESKRGINPDEYTIADLLKAQGYATTCIGKWHLGDHSETLPQELGFDSYFGIPYSNDMIHPGAKGGPTKGPKGMDVLWDDPESTLTKWNAPLVENKKIIELPVDQRTITRRYTDRAIDFVKAHQDRPFFIYLPHSMPHIPLYVPDEIYDADPKTAYTQVIQHMDAEIGRLMSTIKELSLDKNTYVIFTSDNGPWLSYKHHGGSAAPLRDGKGTNFEGGQRVPFIIWGPDRIPAGTTFDGLISTMDLLPTIASMTGAELPKGHRIDGLDMSTVFTGKQERSPRKEFLYYTGHGALSGIRQGKWKLLLDKPKNKKRTLLFDLSQDLGETENLASMHPELVKQLRQRMQELDKEVTQNARPAWKKE